MADEKRRNADSQKQTDPSGVTFQVPLPFLVLGVIILLVTLGWAYYMGFMVGMGEDPKQKLENILSFGQKNEEHAPQSSPETKKEVKAEPDVEAAPAPGAPHPFARPSDPGLEAWGRKPEKPADRKVVKKEPAQTTVQETAQKKEPERKTQRKEPEKKRDATREPTYEVVYQVATFPSQADADSFRKKWDRNGLFRVKKFGSLYRVVVPFRGTTGEAKAMKARYPGIRTWLVISSQRTDGQKAPAQQSSSSRQGMGRE